MRTARKPRRRESRRSIEEILGTATTSMEITMGTPANSAAIRSDSSRGDVNNPMSGRWTGRSSHRADSFCDVPVVTEGATSRPPQHIQLSHLEGRAAATGEVGNEARDQSDQEDLATDRLQHGD